MVRANPAGNLRVVWMASCSNINAPTAAEFTAGTVLSGQMLRDGLTTPKGGNTNDASDVASAFNKTVPSTYGGDPMEMKFREDRTTTTVDAIKAVLIPLSAAAPLGTAGFVGIRRYGGSTAAVIATHRVEVWPGSVISAESDQIGDAPYSFTIKVAITADPAIDVAVV
jgi:hypothetical protein